MKITLGRSSSMGGTRVTHPSNTGISHIANQRIDHLVSAANRKHQEALFTDGTEAWLFTKMRAGAPCTCQTKEVVSSGLSLSVPGSSGVDNSVTKGGPTEEPSITAFRIRDFPGPGGNSALKPLVPPGTTLQEIHQRRMAEKTDYTDGAEMIPVEEENAIDDILSMVDDAMDPDDEARQKQPSTLRLYGGEKTPCGICFGSGFVQGYQLHGGQRIVLDASDTYPTNLVDCETTTTTVPASFVIERIGTKYVEWEVPLPTYFEDVLAIQVRNNTQPAVGFYIEGRIGGGPWVELTPTYLKSLNGVATTMFIRVRPVTSATGSPFTFTHVELYYQLTTTLKVNLPSFAKSIDFEQFDVLQQISGVEFPASIPNLDREAVFVESKYKQAWGVTEVEQKQTARNAVFNNTVTMRLIQQYETKYLLNLVRGKPIEMTFPGTLESRQGQGVVS